MARVIPLAFTVSKNVPHAKFSKMPSSVPSNQYATRCVSDTTQFLTTFKILEQCVDIAPVMPHPRSIVILSMIQFLQDANKRQLLITPQVSEERLASVSAELSNAKFFTTTFS